MFANFLYFIVALLLYTTCQHSETGGTLFDNAVFLFFLFIVIFAGTCRIVFKRLAKQVADDSRLSLEHRLDKAILRLSIFAVFIFALDLYFLRLKLLFSDISFFQIFPTLEALVFLALFVFYLVIVWNFAWNIQKRFFLGIPSKKKFIVSNISFSMPALLPWFILSITADIIQLLPFKGIKLFFATPGGEICYVLVFLFAVAVFGPVLIQKLWGCTSLEPGAARDRIEHLCARAGVKYADIVKWELFGGTMITAGVMGIVSRFRYILVTPALMRMLTADEIDAVIAHEIGHVQKKHMFFYLFFFAGYIASVYALFDPLILIVVYSRTLFECYSFLGLSPETAEPVIFSLILILLFIFYFRYLFGFFMRNCERQADIHVYSLMENAFSLITTFTKIAGFSRQSREKPNWHHFSISQRIDFLERCEKDPLLIEQHNQKIKKMIYGYILLMVLVCFAGYSIKFGLAKESFNTFMAEKILLRQLQIEPGNSESYTLVGDYYYSSGEFEKAINAYENVLKIDSDNLHALNNLAWLFATCSKESLQNYERALILSKKAVKISRASHVLDTYAEACFLNHLYDDAVKAAREALTKEALSGSVEHRKYYKEQLKHFQQWL
ncbi:MAG: M48 family metalloprotease [Thermodesulfobacteriota bacterium]|nr:M48 family metalloprotease [Thermodesulfobacteriota bacterium]